jgi:hypothetical protein
LPARKLLLLFDSIHDVLRAEKLLKGHSIANELIPVPRNLSSDCGMSILLDGDVETVAGILSGIGSTCIYVYDGQSYIPLKTGSPD